MMTEVMLYAPWVLIGVLCGFAVGVLVGGWNEQRRFSRPFFKPHTVVGAVYHYQNARLYCGWCPDPLHPDPAHHEPGSDVHVVIERHERIGEAR